jgi:hypothetical protein
MKKLTAVLLSVLTAVMLLVISSCQNTQPTNPTTDQYSVQDFSLPPVSNTPSEMSDATETQDMQMQVPSGYSNEDCKVMGWGGSQGMGMNTETLGGGLQRWMYLGNILRQLKLDSTQISEIKGFIKDYISCVHDAMVALRQSEKVILQNANQERITILDSLKNGQITVKETIADLKLLNQTTRQALKNNPARLVACEAIKACRDTLFTNIESVLTPDQLTKWLAWKANVPDISCS